MLVMSSDSLCRMLHWLLIYRRVDWEIWLVVRRRIKLVMPIPRLCGQRLHVRLHIWILRWEIRAMS